MANAGGIEHPHRAIALRSTLLRVEWVIGGTTQRSIWLQSEIGSGKSFSEGSARPLSRPIGDRLICFHQRTGLHRLTRLHRLINLSIGQFCQTHGRSRHVLAELQAQIPYPLREDLPELLPTGRMRNPAIGILFLLFIGEHGFEGASMQVQIKYVGGSESVWWDGGKELLIDHTVVHRPDGRWGGSGHTRSQEHAHPRPCGREWNIQTIVERTTGSRLRMPRLLIGWLLQTHPHGREGPEVIVLPAHNDPRSTTGKEIGQPSGIAIPSVQTSQDVAERKRKRAGIAADHRSGSQQFPPVITI